VFRDAVVLSVAVAFCHPVHAEALCLAAGADTQVRCSLHTVLVTPPLLQVQAASATQEAAGTSFDIVVNGGRLISKRRVLVVHRNDEVTLHITSDVADQFHLHGYNMLVELKPGSTTTLRFKANLTGRFTYELHKADLELGALEVYP